MTAHEELIGKLEAQSLDHICECIGATREYNDGKEAMRQWFLAIVRQHFAAQAHDPHHPDVTFAKEAADYSYMDLVNPPQCSEMRLRCNVEGLKSIYNSKRDFTPEQDEALYRAIKIVEASAPKPVSVSLERCARAHAASLPMAKGDMGWRSSITQTKAVLAAAGVAYVD